MPDQPTLEELQDWLARAQQLTGAGLSETEAIDAIRALEELKAAAAAAQARVTAHLYSARQHREATEGAPARERARGLGAEVALARRSHRGRATPTWGWRWR